MNVIGISGLAGAGKTTVANYIEATYGFRRQHIATTLRAMLGTLLRDLGLNDQEVWAYLEGPLKEDVIPELGVTSRFAQITIGTEWGRDLINADLWVNTWEAIAKRTGGNVMNDSVRFPNEEDKIQEMGGFTILVDRPGTKPAAFKHRVGKWMFDTFGTMRWVHPSERIDLLKPTYTISNEGSLADLYRNVDNVMRLEGIAKITPAQQVAA